MPGLTKMLANRYGSQQDVIEDIADTLITEEAYAELDMDKNLAFQKWAFVNADQYLDGTDVDWVGAFYDWHDTHGDT